MERGDGEGGGGEGGGEEGQGEGRIEAGEEREGSQGMINLEIHPGLQPGPSGPPVSKFSFFTISRQTD